PNRRLGLRLDLLLARRRAAPPRVDEPARSLDDLAESVVVLDAAVRVVLPPLSRRAEHRLLDVLQPLHHCLQPHVLAQEFLARLIPDGEAPDYDHLLLGNVPRSEFDADR